MLPATGIADWEVLHETEKYRVDRLSVPGGWLYRSLGIDRRTKDYVSQAIVFVPFGTAGLPYMTNPLWPNPLLPQPCGPGHDTAPNPGLGQKDAVVTMPTPWIRPAPPFTQAPFIQRGPEAWQTALPETASHKCP